MKSLIQSLPFLLLPMLAVGLTAETPAPDGEETARQEAESTEGGEAEEVAEEAAETEQAEGEGPILVPASVSALEQLGDEGSAVPLQSSGPRRGSTFLISVPGLDTVRVSPN